MKVSLSPEFWTENPVSEQLIEAAARAGFDAVYRGDHPEYWWENEKERMLLQTRAIIKALSAGQSND